MNELPGHKYAVGDKLRFARFFTQPNGALRFAILDVTIEALVYGAWLSYRGRTPDGVVVVFNEGDVVTEELYTILIQDYAQHAARLCVLQDALEAVEREVGPGRVGDRE